MIALAARTEVATGLLEAIDVAKRFGGVQALRGVSLRLSEGEIIGLIGPNGSGKTTLLNCISGVFPPTSGEILLDGRSLAARRGHRVARAGVVRRMAAASAAARRAVLGLMFVLSLRVAPADL